MAYLLQGKFLAVHLIGKRH